MYVPFFPASIQDDVSILKSTTLESIVIPQDDTNDVSLDTESTIKSTNQVVASSIPSIYTTGSLYHFSHDSFWWITCLVSNYSEKAWRFITRDVIAKQKELEHSIDRTVKKLQQSYNTAPHSFDKKARSKITNPSKISNELTHKASTTAFNEWWSLFWSIAGRYHDNYRLDEPHTPDYTATPLFYPTWWLQAVRYWRQPEDDASKSVEIDSEFFPYNVYSLCEPSKSSSIFSSISSSISSFFDTSSTPSTNDTSKAPEQNTSIKEIVPYVYFGLLSTLVVLSAVIGACVDRMCFRSVRRTPIDPTVDTSYRSTTNYGTEHIPINTSSSSIRQDF